MSGKRALQHQTQLHWNARDAPRCTDDALPPATWRERAARHREACPILQGKRPPRELQPPCASLLDVKVLSEANICNEVSELPEPLGAEPLGFADDEDGDCWGVLSRVEISRYIARRNARLRAIAEESRQRHSQDHAQDWSTGACINEVPGACADEVPGLEHTAAWSIVLQALCFERELLRRNRSSNDWPDALWSPSCLSTEEADSLVTQMNLWIQDLDSIVDSSDGATRAALKALPVRFLLRQLLSDARCAAGDMFGAAQALWGAVATENGADPLQPPLLIGWDDSLDCDYLKAQHCLRLGRLALIGAKNEVINAELAKDEAYTEALGKSRAAPHLQKSQQAVSLARRLLVDACRLYEAEIASLGKVTSLEHLTLDEEVHWVLALKSSLILALEFQAETLEMIGGRQNEAKTLLTKAVQLTVIVQANALATPRLQRLCKSLHQRLYGKISNLSIEDC